MRKDDDTAIMELLQSQWLLEQDMKVGDLPVLIRTREKVVQIKALKSDPKADDSVVIGSSPSRSSVRL